MEETINEVQQSQPRKLRKALQVFDTYEKRLQW